MGREYKSQKSQSELTVITKAKDLCTYVMTVTQKSPKHFRYTFVSRMQNLSLEAIEQLYRANDTFVTKGDAQAAKERLSFQRGAMTSMRLLCYFAEIAQDAGCILFKQYKQISSQAFECMNYLGAWMNSDRKRLTP